jgi:pimeloyl-ACP methyl ester carboxylesterase
MTTNPTVLFVHGGGEDSYAWDKKIVDRLQPELGADLPVSFPLIEGLEKLDTDAIISELGSQLRGLPPGAIVVGHSAGGAAVIELLAEGLDPKLRHLFLLATPYTAADGEWGDEESAMPADFAGRLPETLPITIWHSKDDEFISPDSARRYAEKLPAAKVHFLDGYGHQFTKSLSFLADAIRRAIT